MPSLQGETHRRVPKEFSKHFACGEVGHIEKNCLKLKDKKDNALVSVIINAANAGDAAKVNLF